MVDAAIDAGIDVLVVTSALAELAVLTSRDVDVFVRCVVEVTAKRRPVFAGLITRDEAGVLRGRHLLGLGVDGLCIGRAPDRVLEQRALSEYYRELADVLHDVPLIISDEPLTISDRVTPETFVKLAAIPGILAMTHFGGQTLERALNLVQNGFRILPPEAAWYPLARRFPGVVQACWSAYVACGPAPLTALRRAIGAHDWRVASRIHTQIRWACRTLPDRPDVTEVVNYIVELGHARLRAAAFIDPGLPRRSVEAVPQRFLDGLTESGRRWAALNAEYSPGAAGPRTS